MHPTVRGPPRQAVELTTTSGGKTRRFFVPIDEEKQMPEMKTFLSVEEFLKEYPVGRTRLYEDIHAGRIRVHKSGRRTLIPSAELQRLVASAQAVAPKDDAA